MGGRNVRHVTYLDALPSAAWWTPVSEEGVSFAALHLALELSASLKKASRRHTRVLFVSFSFRQRANMFHRYKHEHKQSHFSALQLDLVR